MATIQRVALPLECARAAAVHLLAIDPCLGEEWGEVRACVERAAAELGLDLQPVQLPEAFADCEQAIRYLGAQLAFAVEQAALADTSSLFVKRAQDATEYAERCGPLRRAASVGHAEHGAPESVTSAVRARGGQASSTRSVGNATIGLHGAIAEIEVPDFGIDSYRTLVTIKAAIPRADALGRVVRVATSELIALGIVPPTETGEYAAPSSLFEDQAYVVATALRRKRFAIFAEAGWGKSVAQLAWAMAVHRRTGGRVLLVAPLAVVRQTMRERDKLLAGEPERIENLRLRTGGLRAWLEDATGAELAIVNTELFRKEVDLTGLAGIVLDESSILKQSSGTIRNNLVRGVQPVPFRLACSATPAPNDLEEYVSHALFLGVVRTHKEFFADFFASDGEGGWRLRGHATKAFYRFMASWSVWMRDPAVFGFPARLGGVPAPVFHDVSVEATDAQRTEAMAYRKEGHLFLDEVGVTKRSKLAQLSRGFLYDEGKPRAIESRKPAAVVDCVLAHPDERAIVWVNFNEEGALLARSLKEVGRRVALIDGDTSENDRDEACLALNDGGIDVLIAKPSALGFGVNLQGASVCVFSGITDSFEQDYQAFRRCFRYGQTRAVHCYYVATEFEEPMLANLRKKRAAWAEQARAMELAYLEASAADLAVHRQVAAAPTPRLRAELSRDDRAALGALASPSALAPSPSTFTPTTEVSV